MGFKLFCQSIVWLQSTVAQSGFGVLGVFLFCTGLSCNCCPDAGKLGFFSVCEAESQVYLGQNASLFVLQLNLTYRFRQEPNPISVDRAFSYSSVRSVCLSQCSASTNTRRHITTTQDLVRINALLQHGVLPGEIPLPPLTHEKRATSGAEPALRLLD